MNLKNKKAESGFTIMELMIAATIFLVVMTAVFGVLRMGNIARDTINNSSETLNNARISVNAVGRDALNSGLGYSRVGSIVPDNFSSTLLGMPQDSGTSRDLFTSIMSGNNVSTSVLSIGTEKNDVLAFMYRDLQFNNGDPIVISSVAYNANRVDMSTTAGKCAECKKYDLFLVESGNGNHALALATDILGTDTTIRVENGDPLGLNRKTDLPSGDRSILRPCSGSSTSDCFIYSPQATVKRVFLTSYSVNSYGTLVRTTYGNNRGGTAADQIQEMPLAHGVQSFQVRYLMQDGTFTDNPSNGNNNQGNMNEVIQIEVSITIKPDQNSGQVTSNQLIKLTSTFSTRNLKYDVE